MISEYTEEQLIEHIKQIQHTDGWKCLSELINRRIDTNRDLLEKAQEMEFVIRLQTKIKTLRGVLTFDIK
jgi:hypothetical protein